MCVCVLEASAVDLSPAGTTGHQEGVRRRLMSTSDKLMGC